MADHDKGYKHLFSNPQMVADLLRLVREPWVGELDLATLERVSGSYVSDGLRERLDDMVWRVRRGDGNLYVYLLLEFQSSPDPWMALRLLVYVGLLLLDLSRRKELTPSGRLPPVLPLVLYNGDRAWAAPLDVRQLIEPVPGLERHQPRFEVLLIDEQRFDTAELEALHNFAAALFRLEKSRSPADVMRVVATLVEWLDEPHHGNLRRAFAAWIHHVLVPARIPGADLGVVYDLREIKDMLQERAKEWTRSWEQQGIEKGIQKGMEKGIQKGIRQGRREGEALLLSRLLEHKFGPIPGEVQRQLDGAKAEQLLRWGEKVLSAESLEQVFA